MIGRLVAGRYRVEALLGEGGMGVVYRAHDTLLDRPVAVKALSPHLLGPEGLRRLLREAQAAARLTHPHIVAVYDVLEEREQRLIVMEYVDGRPLADLLPLPIPQAVAIATQVGQALHYAHERGVVHRDVKPENILVTPDGRAKVTDFGLARSEGRTRLTQSGLIVGTVAYMAPEQVLGGTVDARSDLYALGCVLYETLTGRRPFGGDDPFTVLSQHVHVMPVAPRWHNDAIPPALDAVVMRLLAKDPAERYASAADLVRALDLAAGPEVPEEAPPTASTRTTLLERIARGTLVGRRAEVAELREHLDRALSGEGRVVLISGEPGIGKTRLAEELAVYARLRGAAVARGHCYEQDVGVPYLPFTESLRQVAQGAGKEALARLGDQASALAVILPEVGERRREGPALSPEDERVRLFDAVGQWLALVARDHPLVFVLDDLHWANPASLRLLLHLARMLRNTRALFLGTYRETELDAPLQDALAQLNRERLSYRIPLRRLTEADTRALLAALLDAESSGELAGAIFRETEGNPFFIEEVVKALVEEGRVYRAEGRWQRAPVVELEIPQSVRAAIGRRLARAGEASQRILTIAAVVGRAFDPDVLVATGQLPEDEVLDALDEAVQLQLIRETKAGRTITYTFEHALIRQTLYDALNPRRRARLHQQVGETLERLVGERTDEHLEELAYHFGEAGLAVAAKGIAYNRRAAEKAARLYALEEGVRRLSVALELAQGLGDADEEVRLQEALGDLLRAFAENRRAADAYRRALGLLAPRAAERGDEILALDLKLAEATAASFGEVSRAPQVVERLAEAVGALRARGDEPRLVRALALLAMHQVRLGDLLQARRHAEEATALAERLGERDGRRLAYRAMASVHRSTNEWPQFREMVARARSLRGETLTGADLDLHIDLIQSSVSGWDFREAERTAREFLALAEQLRSPTVLFHASYWLGMVTFVTNQWEESAGLLRRAVELGERLRGMEFLLGWALVREAWLLAAQGDEEGAGERLRRIEALAYDLPPDHQSPRQLALELAIPLGDLTLIARLLPRVEGEQPHCLTCTVFHHVIVGAACTVLGRVDAAADRVRAAEAMAPARAQSVSLAAVAWLRACVTAARGDLDGASEEMAACLRHLEAQPLWLESAFYREEAARLALRRGRPEDVVRARQLLSEVLDLYRRVGARGFEARAMTVLASLPPDGDAAS